MRTAVGTAASSTSGRQMNMRLAATRASVFRQQVGGTPSWQAQRRSGTVGACPRERSDRMASHNRTAFSREDVPDAKRGYPDFDLRDYATRRGLEFLDHGTPAGFRAAVPAEEDFQSNVLRGRLPGGEYGVIANEALDVGWTDD